MCELLVNDYTRKGFVDGRTARLPTVIVRAGAPNPAASAFASAVFREPLAGRDYVLPVGPETRGPGIGARTVADCPAPPSDPDPPPPRHHPPARLPATPAPLGPMPPSP